MSGRTTSNSRSRWLGLSIRVAAWRNEPRQDDVVRRHTCNHTPGSAAVLIMHDQRNSAAALYPAARDIWRESVDAATAILTLLERD
jgi:hypothetical protein